MKISDCCNAAPKVILGPGGTPDNDTETFGICGDCGDHCNYIEVDVEGDNERDMQSPNRKHYGEEKSNA